MSITLAPYNRCLLQIAILVVLVCVIAVVSTITIKYIRIVLRKVRAKYEEDEFSAKKKKKKSNYVVTSLLVAGVIAFVFIILVIVANKEWGFELSTDKIVLTFVGILATFLVITNYAQVSDIKKDIEGRLDQIERGLNLVTKKMMQDSLEKKEQKRKEENNGEL